MLNFFDMVIYGVLIVLVDFVVWWLFGCGCFVVCVIWCCVVFVVLIVVLFVIGVSLFVVFVLFVWFDWIVV